MRANVNGLPFTLVCWISSIPNITGSIKASIPGCCRPCCLRGPRFPCRKSMNSDWMKRFQKKRSSVRFHSGAVTSEAACLWKQLVMSREYEKYIGPVRRSVFSRFRYVSSSGSRRCRSRIGRNSVAMILYIIWPFNRPIGWALVITIMYFSSSASAHELRR